MPLAGDSDKSFVVNGLILGHFAEVLSPKTGKQDASGVPSKLQNRVSVPFYSSCPDSLVPHGGPWS